jgi:CBS domain-containing protein
MSARAACRLESLGFAQVFRYTPGEADWFANGLPAAGRDANIPKAADIARRDVPTCHLTDRISQVRDAMRATNWNQCLVVNAERVVLGRLRQRVLEGDPSAVVEDVMEPGPATVRLNEPLEPLVKRMQKRNVSSIVVTTSDGELVGVLFREDAERHLQPV